MSKKRLVLVVFLVSALLGGNYVYRLIWGQPYNIDHFADRTLIVFGSQFPEIMTFLGFVENTTLDFHSDRLSDLSPRAQRDRARNAEKQINILYKYDRAELEGQQRLTYDVLEWSMEAASRLDQFPYHFNNVLYAGPYPANTTAGLQVFPLEILDDSQQVIDRDSVERFLDRVSAMPSYIESLEEALRYRSSLGVIPPTVIIGQLVAQANGLIDRAAADWSIRNTFLSHLENLGFERSDVDDWMSQIDKVIAEDVVPAYEAYRDLLLELEKSAPDQVGVWLLPDGAAYYQALLNLHTSSDLDANSIHQIGLQRVAELEREMLGYLSELGFVEGSLPERFQAFSDSEQARYPDGENIKVRILDDYGELVSKLEEGTLSAFIDPPTDPLDVQAVPDYSEDTAPGAYYTPPPIDGSRAGIFHVNLRATGDIERHGMLTLAAHEGVPGHHFETLSARSLEGVPLYRKVAHVTAYSEGWALYAERLVYELGLHDVVSNLGRAQSEMFRAVRLVVDTGIHAKRWPRQKAIDYMLHYTGMPESDVISEIDRYIVQPAQACAYMVGMMEILAMREEARERLQEDFDVARFHQVVLGNGNLPLAVLREEIRKM